MLVAVWPHESVYGWSGAGSQCDRFPVVELEDALRCAHLTDAHFVPYVVRLADGTYPSSIPRVNLPGFAELEADGHSVVYQGIVFDLDDAAAHDSSRPEIVEARPVWREDLDELVDGLPAALRPSVVYPTKRGARLIYVLEAELVGAAAFKLAWAALAERLTAEGLELDPLKDANRCYRLPDVVRDGARRTYGELRYASSVKLPAAYVAELVGAAPERQEVSSRAFAGIGAVNAPITLTGKITSNRNVTLTRLGGKLRSLGMAEGEILEALKVTARLRAPDWEPAAGELERIARSVARYEAAPLDEAVAPAGAIAAAKGIPLEGELRFKLGSETELARAASTELEGAGPPMAYDRGMLYRYEGERGIWSTVEGAKIRALVASWDGEFVGTGKRRADGEAVVVPLRVSASLTSGVLELVEVLRASSGFFDEALDGVTFRNGYVRATADGIVVEDVSPEQRSTAALPWAYVPGAVPPEFVLGLLGECFRDDGDAAERIALIREFIGASLLGIAPRYQVGLVLTGEGANGKSTVLDVVGALFGGGLATSIPPQDLAQEYRRAMLAGARINVVSELPETEILESVAVKAVLTGDAITAREIREAPFRFRPRAGHLFATNELPGVRDMSHGFWRRWAVIPFGRIFGAADADPDIGPRIIRGELEALASWAIDGAAELVARGHYQIPASSIEALHDWRHSADVVVRWLEDKTTETDAPRTAAADLYQSFSQWCSMNGHKNPLSSHKFFRRLKSAGVQNERRGSGVFYARVLRLFSVSPSTSSSSSLAG